MKKIAEKLMAVHTYTHTSNNLKEEKRVDFIYSKSAMQKIINRLLFSKQKLNVCNLKKLLQVKSVY